MPGYRFLADELPGKGITASENRVARLCGQQRIWSLHAKKRSLNRKPGPPVHDDLIDRQFTASRPDQKWLTDITEHPTGAGKLYLCAIRDVCSGKVVGYLMDSRMNAALAVSVRWYLRVGLCYRDVEELLAERGIIVDHVTVYRWDHCDSRPQPLLHAATAARRGPVRPGHRARGAGRDRLGRRARDRTARNPAPRRRGGAARAVTEVRPR